MRVRSKQEIAEIKQQILDYCTEFKKTGEIARHLDIKVATINSYADDLCNNGNFLKRIAEKTRTKTHTWAYKTVIPVYKDLGKSLSAIEEAKWSWMPFGFMNIQVKEHNVQGEVYKMESRAEQLKEADKARRKEHQQQTTKGVYVSGSTLHMAI